MTHELASQSLGGGYVSVGGVGGGPQVPQVTGCSCHTLQQQCPACTSGRVSGGVTREPFTLQPYIYDDDELMLNVLRHIRDKL